ncbi:alpha-L-rhamnosidase [Amnibacterium kyonggiense]|uniref:alpha-L-rhamnosidase n=2 Tax=Amnibacterium kyonggiense TaxID=595671 RepID=A0A4R7FKF3_9MICO|nr:alpha-L-rhamnosidase [Amnibacterium kyonggiense]
MHTEAHMIAPSTALDSAPLLRKEFTLEPGHGAVVRARLALSALGIVEATINGRPVDDHLFTPGWTSYEWRLRAAEIDVTALLEPTSVLGLALGNGWYGGRLAWEGQRALYGDVVAGFADLAVEFEDGAVQHVVSDSTWTAGPGAVLANDLYDGQTIDARRIDGAWQRPGFTHPDWRGVVELDHDCSRLEPYIGPGVSRQQELLPQAVWISPSGRTLVDFGQNIVGWVRIRVQGAAGDEIVVRHAEVLEHDELGTRPLRSAEATDRYVLSGDVDELEPTFTFHGFRYAEITGWPGEIGIGDVTAVVVSSDLDRIGTFTTSDPLINRLHENVVWGMRGNFLDVPTDCPQRDERLGWTGDIAAFAPTAAFLFDVDDFLRDWLRDVALEQRHQDGVIPFVVPDALKYLDAPDLFPGADATAVWSDAGVWVPWALWQAYGDRRVLEDQFGSMTAHVRRVQTLLSPSGVWDTGFQFGDWLDPDAPPEDPAAAKADPGVVATACAYRSADLTAQTAALLGRIAEEAEFREAAERLRAAFQREYVADGRIRSDCTTVYALAIVFGLLDEPDRRAAGDRLAALAAAAGWRISTGFAGTPFITDALSSTGHLDAAYRLLLERECPSWLYPVEMGATTVWERWDSMLPDGSINPGQMTSFNHYALGAVADWMHRVIGGIAPGEPGYRSVVVAPRPGGGMTSAATSLVTPHGRIAVDWRVEEDRLHLELELPEGVHALVRLPGAAEQRIEGGRHRLESAASDVVDATVR